MSDDTYRRALLVIVAFILPVLLYYRIRSQATREPLDRRQEGLFILATLRPVAFFAYGGIIAFLIDPSWMTWSSIPLPSWLRWTGVALCAVSAALWIWTFHRLGPNLTDTVVTRRAHTLVTVGPYRWVRHPFYGCVALFTTGTSLLAANWFVGVTGAIVIALLVVRTRTEEAHLLARFGASYQAYVERTGRFFPRRRRQSGGLRRSSGDESG
jgi:protein-S-isoprenylcysteine O-methyltransferase Ste14